MVVLPLNRQFLVDGILRTHWICWGLDQARFEANVGQHVYYLSTWVKAIPKVINAAIRAMNSSGFSMNSRPRLPRTLVPPCLPANAFGQGIIELQPTIHCVDSKAR